MRALILERPGKVSLESVQVPELSAGDVLVKVEAATTCGTDLKAFRRGHPVIPMPGPFGHEYSGTVAAVGTGARFEIGDAVMGVHSAPCQVCPWCRRGQENLCESILTTMVLGSYAEYLRIPARIANLNLYPKPDHLTFEQASLLEPLACVAQGVEVLAAPPGSRVLVIGPGAIGLMFVAALRQTGIEDISLAGRNEARLAVGCRLGAKALQWRDIDGTTQPPFDYVVECTGQVEVWERSVDFSRRGGTAMLFGGCPSGTKVSYATARLHYDQITLLSPFHFGTSAVRRAREWLIDPKFDLSELLTGDRRLEDAEQVFQDLEQSRGLKYVFKP